MLVRLGLWSSYCAKIFFPYMNCINFLNIQHFVEQTVWKPLVWFKSRFDFLHVSRVFCAQYKAQSPIPPKCPAVFAWHDRLLFRLFALFVYKLYNKHHFLCQPFNPHVSDSNADSILYKFGGSCLHNVQPKALTQEICPGDFFMTWSFFLTGNLFFQYINCINFRKILWDTSWKLQIFT
jgi:hypothetical protein